MTPPSAAAVLLRAADLIGERGWCQGTMRDDEGRVCAVGALQVAVIELGGSTVGSMYWAAYDAASRAVAAPRYVPTCERPTWFNDKPGRTALQVANMLRRAAATCEQGEAVA